LTLGHLLTVPQAAARVGRSSKWIRRRLPEIGFVRDGGLLIPARNLDEYLSARYVPPSRPQDPAALLDEIMGPKRARKGSSTQASGGKGAK
jgi:hypothetical protein